MSNIKKTKKVNLSGRSNSIIDQFIDRKHFSNNEEAIEAALEIMLEAQLQKESKSVDEKEMDQDLVNIQVKFLDN